MLGHMAFSLDIGLTLDIWKGSERQQLGVGILGGIGREIVPSLDRSIYHGVITSSKICPVRSHQSFGRATGAVQLQWSSQANDSHMLKHYLTSLNCGGVVALLPHFQHG